MKESDRGGEYMRYMILSLFLCQIPEGEHLVGQRIVFRVTDWYFTPLHGGDEVQYLTVITVTSSSSFPSVWGCSFSLVEVVLTVSSAGIVVAASDSGTDDDVKLSVCDVFARITGAGP